MSSDMKSRTCWALCVDHVCSFQFDTEIVPYKRIAKDASNRQHQCPNRKRNLTILASDVLWKFFLLVASKITSKSPAQTSSKHYAVKRGTTYHTFEESDVESLLV